MQGGKAPHSRQIRSARRKFSFSQSVTVSTWPASARHWRPYLQHRSGNRGFLKVINEHTIAFADFRGNKQYISTGNLTTEDRVALILVDYPRQARLKILGRVKILEGANAGEWIEKVHDPGYDAAVDRVFVIHVEVRTGSASSTSRRASLKSKSEVP